MSCRTLTKRVGKRSLVDKPKRGWKESRQLRKETCEIRALQGHECCVVQMKRRWKGNGGYETVPCYDAAKSPTERRPT